MSPWQHARRQLLHCVRSSQPETSTHQTHQPLPPVLCCSTAPHHPPTQNCVVGPDSIVVPLISQVTEAMCGPTSAAMGVGLHVRQVPIEYKDVGSGVWMTGGIWNGDPDRCGSLRTQDTRAPPPLLCSALLSRVHTSFSLSSPLLSSRLCSQLSLPLSQGIGEGHNVDMVEGKRQEQE
jgi:hypothetical protein